MTDPIELTGAGVRQGNAVALIADCDDLVALSLSDGVSAVSIFVPAYAARHFAERLLLKAAEVERMAEIDGLGPLVPRGDRSDFACPPMG